MEDRTVRHVGGRPLSQLARDAILESILEQRFDQGRIPPEQELASMLGVSRTTVRAALQSLEQDGVIVRVRGRGTRVRAHSMPSTLALQRLIGFTTMLREAGHDPSVRTEWAVSTGPAPAAVARLNLAAGQRCYVLRRCFYADQRPAIITADTFAADLLRRQLDEHEPIPDSIFEFSDQAFIDPIDHAVVEILAATADEGLGRALAVEVGEPLIGLLETHYTADDTPVVFSAIHVNQQFVRFQVLRRR